MTAGRKLFLPLLVGLASVASASIFGSDDRLVVSHSRGSQFAPIGVAYDPSSDRYGTAFLVDECHVLTVQHVTGEWQANPRGARLDFLVGETRNRNFERRTGATVVESGGFDQRQWNRDADWLLLKLDQCLGREYGYVRLHPGPVVPRPATLHSAGYPSDLDRIRGMLVVDPDCRLVGEAVRIWLHTCAGRAGDSGGPLFQLPAEDNGFRIQVYAIHAAAYPRHVPREPGPSDFDPRSPFIGLNEAVPIANILPKIRKHIRPGPAAES